MVVMASRRPAGTSASAPDFLSRRQAGGLLDVVVVKLFAEVRRSGDLPVALLEAFVAGIVAKTVLARFGLNEIGAHAAEALIVPQRFGDRSPLQPSSRTASATPSSIAWLAPCPTCGSIACAASPSSASRPFVHAASGRRSYSPHQKQLSILPISSTTRGSQPANDVASSSRSPTADHDSTV